MPQVQSFDCEWQLVQVPGQLLPRRRKTRWARPGTCQGSPAPGWAMPGTCQGSPPAPGWAPGSLSSPAELLQAFRGGRRLCQGRGGLAPAIFVSGVSSTGQHAKCQIVFQKPKVSYSFHVEGWVVSALPWSVVASLCSCKQLTQAAQCKGPDQANSKNESTGGAATAVTVEGVV